MLTRLQYIRKWAVLELSAYAKAGNLAEQALSNIKTVMAYGGQQAEIERYGLARSVWCVLFTLQFRVCRFVRVIFRGELEIGGGGCGGGGVCGEFQGVRTARLLPTCGNISSKGCAIVRFRYVVSYQQFFQCHHPILNFLDPTLILQNVYSTVIKLWI